MAEEPAPPPGFELTVPPTNDGLPAPPAGFDRLQSPAAIAPAPATATEDNFFRTTAPGRILDAVGQGYKDAWGSQPIGLSPGAEKFMRDAGVFHHYGEDGSRAEPFNPMKAFNEAVIRPTAIAADAAWRGVQGTMQAAVQGGGQAIAEATGHPEEGEKEAQGLADLMNVLAIESGFTETGAILPKYLKADRAPGAGMLGYAAKEETAFPLPKTNPDGSPAVPLSGSEPPPARAMNAEVAPTSTSVTLPQKPLVDKAGNLNLNYINTPEDVKNVLRQTADDNNQFMAERGFVPQAETKAAAEKLLSSDTRGEGVQYHGTSQPVSRLDDYSYSSLNYYGQGFYTTDAADVAAGYSKKGGGNQPSVYQVNAPENVRSKLFDMESPLAEKDVKAMPEAMQDSYQYLKENTSGPINLRQVYDEIRELSSSEGLSADSIQEFFESHREQLEKEGYTGLKHTGGLKTNKPPHNVEIYWSPRSNGIGLADASQIRATTDVITGIPDFLANLKHGDVLTAAQDTAARMWIEQTGSEVSKLGKVAAQTKDPGDLQAFVEAEQKLRLVMGIDNMSVAEVGRRLNARQIEVGEGAGTSTAAIVEKLEQDKVVDPADRAAIIAQMDTPQQVAGFLSDSKKPTFADMFIEYQINRFLSGPITHSFYFMQNLGTSLWRSGVETPIAAMVGGLRKAVSGGGMNAAEFKAMQAERTQIAARLAASQSTQDESLLAADAQKLQNRLGEIDDTLEAHSQVFMGESGARLYGMAQGAPEGIMAAYKALKSGEIGLLPTEKPFNPASGSSPPAFARNAIPGPLGTVIRLPTRMIGAIHTFQKVMGYSESLNALAYRQAFGEGLRDDALAARMAQIKADPAPEMMEAARDEAKYSALMGESGKFGKRMEQLANTNVYTKSVLPFVRVMDNVIGQGLGERTPLGLLSGEVRAALAGEKGGAAQDTAIARMAVGSSVMLAMVGLAHQGLVTGAAPSNTDEAHFQAQLEGQPPYSIRLGNVFYPYRHWGPLGSVIGTGADFYGAVKHGAENESILAAAGYFAATTGERVIDESFAKGLHDLMQAVTDHDRYGEAYVRDQIGGMLVPFSVGLSQIDRVTDPVARQSKTIMEAVKKNIPGLSQTLVPKVDIFGQPIGNGANLAAQYRDDPVVNAMRNAGVFPAPVGARIGGIKLTEDQYYDYAHTAGTSAYAILDQIVGRPDWQEQPPYVQGEIIAKIVDMQRYAARAYMRFNYPSLPQEGYEQKLDLINGVKPKK